MTIRKAYRDLKKHLVSLRKGKGLFGTRRDHDLEQALETALLTFQKLSNYGPDEERIKDNVDSNAVPALQPRVVPGRRAA